MQVGTYPTRDYATLGPSELQPPFASFYIKCIYILFSIISTGQVSNLIHHFTILQSFVFLLNSRDLHFLNFNNTQYTYIIKNSFSRSYRVNLPSSFNIIHLFVLIHFRSIYQRRFTVRS